MKPRADFLKVFRELVYREQPWRVFADFCELATLEWQQVMWKAEDREARYLDLAGRYGPEGMRKMSELFTHTMLALDERPHDFLGSVFQELNLASHWHGQFFTPSALCDLMARMVIGDGTDLKAVVAKRGYILAEEPACGAGAMAIAFSQALREAGIEPQEHLCLVARDVDRTACHMTYVQLSFLYLPARVEIGNTLSMEVSERLYTTAYHMGFWENKLRRTARAEAEAEPRTAIVETPPEAKASGLQLELY